MNMTTFLTIIVVEIINTLFTTAMLVGGIEFLYEKIEKEKKDGEHKSEGNTRKYNKCDGENTR